MDTKLLLGSLLVIASCSQPQLGESELDLEDMRMNFNVAEFYSSAINKYEDYQIQKEEILNGKSKDDFGDDLINFWDLKFISIDTMIIHEFSYDEPSYIGGVQYNMNSWSVGDSSVCYYQNMYFERINMMTNPDGEFLAAVATNESVGDQNFNDLLDYLQNKYGEYAVLEDDFFGKYYVYYWLTNDRLLAVSSKYDDKKNTMKMGINVTDEKVEFDTVKTPTINTKIFIANKDYLNADIFKEMNSGEWLYFSDLFDED